MAHDDDRDDEQVRSGRPARADNEAGAVRPIPAHTLRAVWSAGMEHQTLARTCAPPTAIGLLAADQRCRAPHVEGHAMSILEAASVGMRGAPRQTSTNYTPASF